MRPALLSRDGGVDANMSHDRGFQADSRQLRLKVVGLDGSTSMTRWSRNRDALSAYPRVPRQVSPSSIAPPDVLVDRSRHYERRWPRRLISRVSDPDLNESRHARCVGDDVVKFIVTSQVCKWRELSTSIELTQELPVLTPGHPEHPQGDSESKACDHDRRD